MSRTPPPDAARVAAASAAWIWVPDQAQTIETDDVVLVRYPDWFFHQLELARFGPSGDVAAALDAALAPARTFEVPELVAWVRLDAPEGLAEAYAARGGVVDETLDVLALELAARPRRPRPRGRRALGRRPPGPAGLGTGRGRGVRGRADA